MAQYNLLGISGSLRAGSFNTKLVQEAARLFDPAAFSLAEIDMPLFDGDAEAADGQPPQAHAFFEAITQADAVIISTPEYNGAVPGGLKNAFDWLSRIEGNPLAWKPTAIMAAAAGRAGGVRALHNLRHVLAPFQPLLVPGPEIAVAGAGKEFGEDNRLISEHYEKNLKAQMDGLRELAGFAASRAS